MFCSECGTFIAVGSKAFSRRSPEDGSVAMPAMPGGTMSLGSYAVAMRRRADRRRVLMGAVSVALVAVVGLAAVYVATSRGGPADANPAALAAASTAPSVAQTDEPPLEMGLTAGTLDLGEVELEEELDPVLGEGDSAAPEVLDAESDVTQPEPADDSQVEEPEPVVEPAAEPELVVEPEPVEPEPVVEPPAEPEPEPAEPEVEDGAVWRNGWVCDGELRLEDERLRDWTINRASFLPGDGYERVTLHLSRIGAGSGEPAAVTVEAMPTARVQREIRGVRQPSAGRTTVALQFHDGVKTDLTVRRYEPNGLRSIKQFSAYPAGGSASRVLISAAADGCFKMRVPAWTGAAKAQKGQIHIDIKS